MEIFNSALQGKAMLMYEYFLVGSVHDRHKDGFLEILRGLCDNPENRPIEFLETEWAYSGRKLTVLLFWSIVDRQLTLTS